MPDWEIGRYNLRLGGHGTWTLSEPGPYSITMPLGPATVPACGSLPRMEPEDRAEALTEEIGRRQAGYGHLARLQELQTGRFMKYTDAGSLSRPEVGRRIRASRRRLADSDLEFLASGRKTKLATSARSWRVWAVCSELTASWGKGSDRVHVATIANLAGLREDKVSPILRAFDEEGIFSWRKETGRRGKGLLSLPPLSEPEPESRSEKPTPRKPKCFNCQSEDFQAVESGRGSERGVLICQKCHSWCESDGQEHSEAVVGAGPVKDSSRLEKRPKSSDLPPRLRNLPTDHPAVVEHRRVESERVAQETERLFGGPSSDEKDKEKPRG